ncbi:serine aminopeptidase domain-containing protein [Escherichia coli]
MVGEFQMIRSLHGRLPLNLAHLYKTSERIVSDAAAITLPTQLLISGDDDVAHRQPQIDFIRDYVALRKSCICCQAFITTRWVKRTGAGI